MSLIWLHTSVDSRMSVRAVTWPATDLQRLFETQQGSVATEKKAPPNREAFFFFLGTVRNPVRQPQRLPWKLPKEEHVS